MNGNEIATHMQSKINAISGGTANVSYSDNTGKFTITNTTNFYLKFGDITTNTCHQLLGFNQSNTSDNTSVTSDNVSDLTSFKCIYINIQSDEMQNIINENYGKYSFVIQGNSDFGDKLTYISKYNDIIQQAIKLPPTKRLQISFYDENNNAVIINNWVLTLEQ